MKTRKTIINITELEREAVRSAELTAKGIDLEKLREMGVLSLHDLAKKMMPAFVSETVFVENVLEAKKAWEETWIRAFVTQANNNLRWSIQELRRLWEILLNEVASDAISYKRPRTGYRGVHIRRWKDGKGNWSDPNISLESDPGYAGIGSALTVHEARGLAAALTAAADRAEEIINEK